MTTVTLDDALQARIQAVAAPEEDFETFIAAAAQEMIARRERLAAQTKAAQAKAQAILNGPRHTLEESNERMRAKYDIPDLSHLTREEREADAERIVAALDPQVRAKMEREGLL